MRRLLLALSIVAVIPEAARAQAAPITTDVAALPSVTLPSELDRVLRDYERLWRAGDAAALSAVFAEDGLVMQGGRMPVRGRAAITAAYGGQGGGALRLRAFAYATADTVGYILGGYAYGDAPADVGKFTLALRQARGGAWEIFSDMDNMNWMPRRPAPGAGAAPVPAPPRR